MLLCTVVPKMTATLFLMLPPNFADKLPDHRPPLPELREPDKDPQEAKLQELRRHLTRIEAKLQLLEHQPGNHQYDIDNLLMFAEWRRQEFRRIKEPVRGALMLLATPDQLRELRGLPPLPRKGRD